MKINSVVVIGAGLMGRQIALNSAVHGYKVVLNDLSSEVLKSAEEWVESYLTGRVVKGKMTEEVKKSTLANMNYCQNMAEAVQDCDLVIEAIIEKEDIKRELFATLDRICKAETILASNSSFIPSSKVADATNRPGKVANLHYFNPAMVMELVEVVQGEHTSEDTVNTLLEFAQSCGKQTVHVQKEIDGFVANRILRVITEEALYLVDNGYVTPQEVDIAAEKGLNHPMGPFRLMDVVGIDLTYYARMSRYENTGDPKAAPPAFLKEKFEKGEFGKKTGKGWYDYSQK